MDPLSARLKAASEAPEPFRDVLRRQVGREPVRTLILTPPGKTFRGPTGASLLAVTESGWIRLEDAAGEVRVSRSDFVHTFLAELMIVLLYGRLKIDFSDEDRPRSEVILFHSTAEPLYRGAVEYLLDGVAGRAPAGGADPEREAAAVLQELPLRFRNALPRFVPTGERVLSIVHWPAALVLRRGLRSKPLQEGLLLLSERELIVLSESAALEESAVGKYGESALYCPRSRLRCFRIAQNGPLATLALEVGAADAVRTIRIELPSEHANASAAILERACSK